VHDGSAEVVACFPQSESGGKNGAGNVSIWGGPDTRTGGQCEPSAGSAARFFYTAKAGKAERGKGNNHPTVKPLDLMAYLCRLVTPPGGTVLDPFMGSGTTIKAALSEGFNAVGIELDPAYFEIVRNRLDGAQIGLGIL
jgi:site-specific DNA-methyltransferase (adenine-specific)